MEAEPGTVEALREALTDEQIQVLEDGEELEFLMDDDREMNSMGVILLGWYTQGVYDDTSLEEAYPDVIGLGGENPWTNE